MMILIVGTWRKTGTLWTIFHRTGHLEPRSQDDELFDFDDDDESNIGIDPVDSILYFIIKVS